MTLYKLESTADIFLGILIFFRTRYLTKQPQTSDSEGFSFA